MGKRRRGEEEKDNRDADLEGNKKKKDAWWNDKAKEAVDEKKYA